MTPRWAPQQRDVWLAGVFHGLHFASHGKGLRDITEAEIWAALDEWRAEWDAS